MSVIRRLLLACVALATPLFATSHAYWRVNITAAYNTTSLAELKFFDGTGTQIATTGGTASASSVFGGIYVAANAFDGNVSTFWNANATPTTGAPEWLQYQFASAVDVVSFSIAVRNDCCPDQGPRAFTLQYSDSGSSWTTLYNYYGVAWQLLGESHTFTSVNVAVASPVIYWRLYITGVVGTNTVSIAKWELFDTIGNPIATTRYTAVASSVFTGYDAGGAFDGNTATFWDSANTPPSPPETLEYKFDSNIQVGSFCLTNRSDFVQSPTDFSLQHSTDETTWTTSGTFTAATWTTGSQRQCFNTVAPTLGGSLAFMILDGLGPTAVTPPSPASAYSLQHVITIDHTQVVGGSDLSHYPFLFTGAVSWLKTVANGGSVTSSSGYDITFSSDAGGTHMLNYERVKWNGTTGAIEFWIDEPTLSASVDTVIYVHVGNSLITTDQSNPTAVWDANYMAVYHFGDGSAVNMNDSTSNAHTATNHSTTAGTGDWGGAAVFNGSGDIGNPSGAAYIDIGSPLNNVPITVEAYGRALVPIGGQTWASNIDASNHGYEMHMPSGTTNLYGKLDATDHLGPVPGGVFWPDMVCITYDGSTLNIFNADLNGLIYSQSYSLSSALTASSTNLLLGREPTNATNLYYGGFMDEVRISKVARSFGYWSTTRNNIFQNVVFYTVT